ncbi:MAG TPA: DUF167 domain-containing protein [Gemmatimonadaceae bacterium]|nr:DUF167 domain-containing protein [Gemmatimonadaceae bacterium]
MSDLMVQERAGAVRFSVRVQPRAGRTALDGTHAGALRVRLAAAPVDGAANEALVELLADRLDVPRSAITIVSGATSRTKLVEVHGVDAARARELAARR